MAINNFVNILLVEDNEGDIELAREAFEDGKIINNLIVTRTAEEASDVLMKRNGHEDVATPDLILLDLNLPTMSGHEFLEKIGKDKDFGHIPIVILTSSIADKDILKSYDLNAICYMVKPLESSKILDIITDIDGFGIGIMRKSG